ncbi:MAG TPA: hypothetical protein VGJ34_10185 [Gaiellaceae bacterium]|jgi:hypothetical protein
MPDALERRATTTAAVAGLVAVLESGAGFAFTFGISAWHVALYVAALAGLTAAIALALLAVAPEHPRTAALPGRATLLFWAQAAFAAAILLVVVNASASAVQALGNNSPFE